MKPGFLGHKDVKRVEKNEQKHCLIDPASDGLPEQQPDRSAAPQGQQQLESWNQCLQLLRSDVDEKKFVGLLLVTKLLPQGDDNAVQQVVDAVGLRFIHRLLLPLQNMTQQQQQQQQQQQMKLQDEAKLQQQHLSVVLGLSILSVACRLPQISSSEDILQLLPLLLRVAAAGGVSAAMLQSPAAALAESAQQPMSTSIWADPVSEAAAAADALDCILACVTAGSYQQAVALESNVFTRTVRALHVALDALLPIYSSSSTGSSGLSGPSQESGAAVTAVSRLQAIMLTTQLLSVLLAQHSSTLVQQYPDAAAAAVVLLATVLKGLPQAATSSSSDDNSNGIRSAGSNRDVDPAALQLEALHTLLLLLPLPENSQAAALLTQATAISAREQQGQLLPNQQQQLSTAATVSVGNWLAALRHGLCQLLQSKVGVVQRHSALCLAAAALDVLGADWLLPSQQQLQQQARESVTSSDDLKHFLLVLMELLAIETPLLLSDAMNPDAVVPRADLSMPARTPPPAAERSQEQQHQGEISEQPSATTDMDVEADDSTSSGQQQQQQQALSVQQVLKAVQQQEARASSSSSYQQHSSDNDISGGPPGFKVMTPDQQQSKSVQQQLAELQLPADKAPGPQQQVAGDRAEQCLPACFQLLEGCLDVLVQQAALLEQLADITNVPSTAADDTVSVLPTLSWDELNQLMQRMQQVMEVLLEFLQFATTHPGTAAVNPLLTVGAVRVLGRFLADAPDVHQDLVRKLLPRLLAVQVPGEPLVSGVSFLLPALLSWTHSRSARQLQWVDVMLQDDGRCLSALADFIVQLTMAAQSAGSSSADVLAEIEARLGTSCLVLQQLLSTLPAAVALQQTKAQANPAERSALQQSSTAAAGLPVRSLQAVMPVLQDLSSWGCGRMQQQQQKQRLHSTSAETAAAEFLQSLQAVGLDLGVILSAAAVTGHLLLLASGVDDTAAPGTNPGHLEAAGKLLSWGCEAGWSKYVLNKWRGSDQGSDTTPETVDQLLERASTLLDIHELEELWEACLSRTAELVLTKSAMHLLGPLRSALWTRHASQYECEADATVGFQLLLQALRSAS